MKDQGRGPTTYVVPWAPHLLNWALALTTLEVKDKAFYTTKVCLDIAALDDHRFHRMNAVFTRGAIPVGESHIVRKSDLDQWDHLKDLNLPQVKAGAVTMLIGQLLLATLATFSQRHTLRTTRTTTGHKNLVRIDGQGSSVFFEEITSLTSDDVSNKPLHSM